MSSKQTYQNVLNSHLKRAERHLESASNLVKPDNNGITVIRDDVNVMSYIHRALFHIKNAKLVVDTIQPDGDKTT